MIHGEGGLDTLCHQVREGQNINVTLYLLQSQQTRKFTIMSSERVYFGSCGNLIVSFIPNKYLRLIDNGYRRRLPLTQPNTLLTITGSQASDSVGSILINIFPHKSIMHVVNVRTGKIYQLQSKNLFLSKYFSSQPDLFQPFASTFISYGIDHYDDLFLKDACSTLICELSNCPKIAKDFLSRIFHEYLCVSTFVDAFDHRMDKDFLNIIPSGVLQRRNSPCLIDTLRCHPLWSKLKVPPMRKTKNVEPPSPNVTTSTSYLYKKPNKVLTTCDMVNMVASVADTCSSSTSSSSSCSSSYSDQSYSNAYEMHSSGYKHVFYTCLELCIRNMKTGKPWLAKKWSHDYTNIVSERCKRLFDMVYKSVQSSPYSIQFRTLSCLMTAFENASLPPPSDFHRVFAIAAYHHLPRRLFVQFVMREVIVVTVEFVQYVFSREKYCRSTSELLALLDKHVYERRVTNDDWQVEVERELKRARQLQTKESQEVLLRHFDESSMSKLRSIKTKNRSSLSLDTSSSPIYLFREGANQDLNADSDDDVVVSSSSEKCFSPLVSYLNSKDNSIEVQKYSYSVLKKSTPFVFQTN
ncbi:hypothetical protein AKO1_014018 [Acrasis kona]|uniref:Gamma-secretase-activating protein C-terminal domain-containing protein n=1 Tax=Acrasis kona TaxID=1008807 RepID=A0AAW2Z1X8_9EUKA